MLLLGSANTVTVDGITCFPDDADPTRYWYLPGPVQLARDGKGKPRLDLIMFVGAADNALDDGGYLMLEVDLRLEPEVERRIRSRLRAIAGGPVELTPVQFDEGTVRCLAFDLEGPGGTATVAADGTFRAVERISGATTPSFGGTNNAIFTLKLSKAGATIVQQCLKDGSVPVGVLYDLTYTGLRPALEVTITADMSRVFTQFSASLEAQIYYVRAGLDAGFEKLVQDGAIKIVVKNFSTAADRAEKEKWALDFFKENLLAKYFDPVLTPGKLAGTPASAAGLNDVVALGQKLRPAPTAAPPKPEAGPTPPPPAKPPSSKSAPGDPDHDTGSAQTSALTVPPETAAAPDVAPSVGTGVGGGNPQAPAAAATGLGFDPSAIASRGGDLAQSISPVSFKLKFIRQEERRTLTLEYHRSEAVQMPYNAQGFLDVLTADLNRGGMVHPVDLNNVFFRDFDVEATKQIDFDRIGLNSVQLVLDYGDPADPAHKHEDFMFTKADPSPTTKSWKVAMANIQATSYRRQVEYNFDPQSGWEGTRFEVDIAGELTDDRRYEINPYEHLNFLEIEVRPDPLLDWGAVREVTATITLEGAGAPGPSKTMKFTEGDEARRWRIRALARRDSTGNRISQRYETELRYLLQDGGEKVLKSPGPIAGEVVNVGNPYAGLLVFEVRPLLGPGVEMAILDIDYLDAAHDYRRQLSIELTPASGRQTRLHRMAVPDPAQRSFRYTITTITADGPQTQNSQPTANPRIFVR
jgi:hypothetical protein